MTAQLQLPLLGSNQDSPDPESVVSAASAVELLGDRARIAPESAESTHDFPHGLFHRPRATMSQRRREEWERLLGAFGYCCAYCGEKPAMLYRDHAFPKVRGGDDEIENILPACGGCNSSKGARTPLEWLLWLLEPRIEPRKKKAKKWPVSPDACPNCGGKCQRRTIGTAYCYDVCKRCKWFEHLIDRPGIGWSRFRPVTIAPSAGGRQP